MSGPCCDGLKLALQASETVEYVDAALNQFLKAKRHRM